MQKSINHPVYGRIVYDEDLWTGKKALSINGVALHMQDKKTFMMHWGGALVTATVRGNVMTGTTLVIQGEDIPLFPKPSVLDWVLAFAPLVLNIVWGNSVQLCQILPMVGGAVGGAINGMALSISLLITKEKRGFKKILYGLLVLAAAAVVSIVLGFILLSTMAAE